MEPPAKRRRGLVFVPPPPEGRRLQVQAPAEVLAGSTPRTARELYLAASAGDTDAATLLGYKYWKGFGVDKNTNLAQGLFAEAARRGDPDAMIGLGCICASLEQQQEMRAHFEMAVEECDYPYAHLFLGTFYCEGPRHALDLDRAVVHLRKAAGARLRTGILMLAHALLARGRPTDSNEVIQLLRLGATLDYLECMFCMATFLVKEAKGTSIYDVEFTNLMLRAAELGSRHARAVLAANGIEPVAIGPLSKHYDPSLLFSFPASAPKHDA